MLFILQNTILYSNNTSNVDLGLGSKENIKSDNGVLKEQDFGHVISVGDGNLASNIQGSNSVLTESLAREESQNNFIKDFLIPFIKENFKEKGISTDAKLSEKGSESIEKGSESICKLNFPGKELQNGKLTNAIEDNLSLAPEKFVCVDCFAETKSTPSAEVFGPNSMSDVVTSYLDRISSSHLYINVKPALDYTGFDWIFICVSVIPLLFFFFCIYIVISLAYRTDLIKKSTFCIKQQKESLFFLNITAITKIRRTCSISLFLEIINVVNWDRHLILFGQQFVSTPSVSILVCCILVLCRVGASFLLNNLILSRKNILPFTMVLPFLFFFLVLLPYCYTFIALFLVIEAISLCICVLLQLSDHELTLKPSTSYSKVNVFLSKFSQNKQSVVAASLLYFLLNIVVTLSLGLLMFFLILFFNTLGFPAISFLLSKMIYNQQIQVLILLCVISFAFKLGVVPFHFWLPGVFSGANYVVLYLLAIPVKFVFLIVFYKLLYGSFFYLYTTWSPILLFLGLCSIIVGSIGLFTQTEIKKFLAYSTINHFGNIFIALGCGSLMGQKAFLVYIFSYLLTSLAFLLFLMGFVNKTTNQPIFSINEFSNDVRFSNFITQFFFGIVLLSMLGLPPLLGFWGKFYLLFALIGQWSILGYFLAGAVILTSVIAAVSYLNVFKNLFVPVSRNVYVSYNIFFSKSLVSLFSVFVVIIIAGGSVLFLDSTSFLIDSFILSNYLENSFLSLTVKHTFLNYRDFLNWHYVASNMDSFLAWDPLYIDQLFSMLESDMFIFHWFETHVQFELLQRIQQLYPELDLYSAQIAYQFDKKIDILLNSPLTVEDYQAHFDKKIESLVNN